MRPVPKGDASGPSDLQGTQVSLNITRSSSKVTSEGGVSE